jgi:hypothetical protein
VPCARAARLRAARARAPAVRCLPPFIAARVARGRALRTAPLAPFPWASCPAQRGACRPHRRPCRAHRVRTSPVRASKLRVAHPPPPRCAPRGAPRCAPLTACCRRGLHVLRQRRICSPGAVAREHTSRGSSSVRVQVCMGRSASVSSLGVVRDTRAACPCRAVSCLPVLALRLRAARRGALCTPSGSLGVLGGEGCGVETVVSISLASYPCSRERVGARKVPPESPSA